MRRHRFGTAQVVALLLMSAVVAQPVFAQDAGVSAARPIPRLPNEDVSFEAPPGGNGVWEREDYRSILPETPEQAALRDRWRWDLADPSGLKPRFSDVPFQPWAEALYSYRQENEIEPYGRCKPAGGFRNMAIPYGTDFVQVPEQQRIYIFHTGGSHSFRTIHMDGRPHPEDPDPSYGGHTIGHWEGDTLVLDTVGFNERGWIDPRGIPNTKQLHLVERITRLSFETLSYQMIVEDPGAYTAPWSTGMLMTWTPDRETFQFLCQDDNMGHDLMVGEGSSGIDRTSSIIP